MNGTCHSAGNALVDVETTAVLAIASKWSSTIFEALSRYPDRVDYRECVFSRRAKPTKQHRVSPGIGRIFFSFDFGGKYTHGFYRSIIYPLLFPVPTHVSHIPVNISMFCYFQKRVNYKTVTATAGIFFFLSWRYRGNKRLLVKTSTAVFTVFITPQSSVDPSTFLHSNKTDFCHNACHVFNSTLILVKTPIRFLPADVKSSSFKFNKLFWRRFQWNFQVLIVKY